AGIEARQVAQGFEFDEGGQAPIGVAGGIAGGAGLDGLALGHALAQHRPCGPLQAGGAVDVGERGAVGGAGGGEAGLVSHGGALLMDRRRQRVARSRGSPAGRGCRGDPPVACPGMPGRRTLPKWLYTVNTKTVNFGSWAWPDTEGEKKP